MTSERPVLALLAALLLVPAGAEAKTRSCGSIGFEEQTDNGVFGITATGVGCRTARRVARAAEDHGIDDAPYRYRAAGFACRGRLVEQGLTMVRYRCTKGRAVVRFDRS